MPSRPLLKGETADSVIPKDSKRFRMIPLSEIVYSSAVISDFMVFRNDPE